MQTARRTRHNTERECNSKFLSVITQKGTIGKVYEWVWREETEGRNIVIKLQLKNKTKQKKCHSGMIVHALILTL